MNRAEFFARFANGLDRLRITALARQCGWLVRQGKIDAFEFVVGRVLGQLSAMRLTLDAEASAYSEPVTRQGVHQRYTSKAVELSRLVFQHYVHDSLTAKLPPVLSAKLAQHFPAIHVVDSTSFDCPESLAKIFPGCGGAASTANCKVLLRYEYLRSHFEPLALLPGKRSDPGLASWLPAIPQAAELLLIDKGFFKLEALEQIQDRGAYFLIPWPHAVCLWLPTPTGSRQALDLASELAHTSEQVPEVSWSAVHLGRAADSPAWRLVAFRLSPESAGRQRAALREAQRKQGRQPTAQALELAGWLILITNAPADKLPTSALSCLYRVRWQIELVFKQCKMVLRLDVTEADSNEYRVQCEIWDRLTAAAVVFSWHGQLQAALSQKQPGREISFARVASRLRQNGLPLALAFIRGTHHLEQELWRLWRQLFHTAVKGRQRTRRTTLESLNEYWLTRADT
jgi:hypothetical protein